MQQMAFQHPPLRHLRITLQALKMDCLQSEFGPLSILPLEADGLRNLGSCDAVTSSGSWVDAVTAFRGFFHAKQAQRFLKKCLNLG